MTLCGMESIILTLDLIKVLGIFFSYHKQIESKENFVKNIVLKTFSKFEEWEIL